jgi:hypothetical protein
VLEDAILATDLALYFKRRKETLTKVRAGISWQVRTGFKNLISSAQKETLCHLIV